MNTAQTIIIVLTAIGFCLVMTVASRKRQRANKATTETARKPLMEEYFKTRAKVQWVLAGGFVCWAILYFIQKGMAQ